MLPHAKKRRKTSHPRPIHLCKDSKYGNQIYPYGNLRMQCLWTAIDHGLLGPAISDGRMPPYLVLYQFLEAGYFALKSNSRSVSDLLFNDQDVPQYREAMMAHPVLYREHEFRVAYAFDIQGVPRDIERLSFVQKQGSHWKEMNSFLNDFSSLTSLNLRHIGIGDEGAASLANSANLASLTSLDLCRNEIGFEGAALFKKILFERMPNCKVRW